MESLTDAFFPIVTIAYLILYYDYHKLFWETISFSLDFILSSITLVFHCIACGGFLLFWKRRTILFFKRDRITIIWFIIITHTQLIKFQVHMLVRTVNIDFVRWLRQTNILMLRTPLRPYASQLMFKEVIIVSEQQKYVIQCKSNQTLRRTSLP